MKDQEIIKKSDERKMKRFRQAVTGNRLMTESQIRKMERNALIQQSLSSSHLKVSIKRQKKSVYRYVQYGFPSRLDISSERRTRDFLMTRGHKSQNPHTLVKQCFH